MISGRNGSAVVDGLDDAVSAQGTADLSSSSTVEATVINDTDDDGIVQIPETITVDCDVNVVNTDVAAAIIDNDPVEEIPIIPPGSDLVAPLKKASGRTPRYRHWAFTYNNYTDDDVDRISIKLGDKKRVTYAIFGKEVAKTGTPHLQGYVSFKDPVTSMFIMDYIGRCYTRKAVYPAWNNYKYCSKEGDYKEFGELSLRSNDSDKKRKAGNQGERMDLIKFKKCVKALETQDVDKKELRDEHSSIAAQYPRFFEDYINDHCNVAPPVEKYPLRKWQAKLYEKLKHAPDKRKITFIVDVDGNSGKSWFAQYYQEFHEKDTFICNPAKKVDMAFLVPIPGPRVVFMDAPRSKQGEFIQYDFLEELKNGFVVSTKYTPVLKRFHSPHIVVSMNEMPDLTKLSADRYDIMEITKADLEMA